MRKQDLHVSEDLRERERERERKKKNNLHYCAGYFDLLSESN